MILSISKIATRVFALLSVLLFFLAALFVFYSYYENVHSVQKTIGEEIQAKADKLSATFSGPEIGELAAVFQHHPKQITREYIHTQLPRLNGLEFMQEANQNIIFEFFTHGDTPEETVAFNHKELYSHSSSLAIHRNLQHGQMTLYKLLFEDVSNTTLSAIAPLKDETGKTLGRIYVYQSMGPYFAKKKSKLIFHFVMVLMLFGAIGIFMNRTIKRVFRQEVLANKKMYEYDRQTAAKTREINKLLTVFSKTDSLILLTDAEGTIEWINQIDNEKANFDTHQLRDFKGKNISEVSYYPKIGEVVQKVVATKIKGQYESKSYTKNKTIHWSSTTVTPIMNDAGELENLLFIDSDITNLKNAEAEIEKLAKFPAENNRPVLRVDFTGQILYSNDSAKMLQENWTAGISNNIVNSGIMDMIRNVVSSKKEEEINYELNSRMYNLRFHPIENESYINIYGEDITELYLAETERISKAEELEKVNMNITDSINYARTIQQSILPDEDVFRKYFKDSFVISKPKQIVSGDFFYLHELAEGREYLIASIDCTGHGVPGAMMSIVAHGLLTEIVEKQGVTDPATILEMLNKEIISTLRQKTNLKSRDGMDISLVHLDRETGVANFAGAYRPLLWVNGKVNLFKGNRYPIGGLHHDSNRKFTSYKFKVHKGDALYLFSDGFVDQFGGPFNKKFLFRNFTGMIEENHRLSMQAQSNIYNHTFDFWKGDTEQIDDVSLMGIRI